MEICIPIIVGPISEASKSILIKTALAGAKLSISSVGSNPRIIVSGVSALGGEDRIPLSGVALKAGDVLVVKQIFNGEISETNPTDGTHVQAVPSGELPHVIFGSTLYECAEYIWVTGAIPGATVEVYDESTRTRTLLGEGIANEGIAAFKLLRGIPDNKISVRQVIPSSGQTGLYSPGFPERNIPGFFEIQPPIIRKPTLTCDSSVFISGVIAGATVTLLRKPAETQTLFGFPSDNSWVPVGNPLKDGETLAVKQSLAPRCETFSDFSPEYVVEKTSQIGAPIISSPICSGLDRIIIISNLRPNSLVKIYLDGVLIGSGQTPNADTSQFKIKNLGEGMLYATQELCLPVSVSQPSVSVRVEAGNMEQSVNLIEPIYACGKAVFVDNVKKGTVVRVWKKDREQKTVISGTYCLYDTEATIDVNPLLREGDEIWIEQWSCGNVKTKSNSTIVKRPVIQQLEITNTLFAYDCPYGGESVVDVKNAVPGGIIQVFARPATTSNWYLVGTAIAKHNLTSIKIPFDFETGDTYRVRQMLCDSNEKIIQFSPEKTVIFQTFKVTPSGRPSAPSPSITANQDLDLANKWTVTGNDFSKNTAVNLSSERFDSRNNPLGNQAFGSLNVDSTGNFTKILTNVSSVSGEEIKFKATTNDGKEYTVVKTAR